MGVKLNPYGSPRGGESTDLPCPEAAPSPKTSKSSSLIEENGCSFGRGCVYSRVLLHLSERPSRATEESSAIKHFKRNFVRILLVLSCVFTGGRVNAESSLPPCRGDYNETTWTDCVGTKTNATGSKYVGQFRDGKYHEQGTFTDADGKTKSGEWRDGEMGSITGNSSGKLAAAMSLLILRGRRPWNRLPACPIPVQSRSWRRG
ncbi:MAG TPA: hypothetical protein EYG54_04520 [Myxococcales bacterium]|nr:hypothetical protein [Myxococcales bacterium]